MLLDQLNFETATDSKKSIFHLNHKESTTPTTFRLKKVEQVDYDLFIALKTIWEKITTIMVGISNSVIC